MNPRVFLLILTIVISVEVDKLIAQPTWRINLDSIFCNDQCDFSPGNIVSHASGSITILNQKVVSTSDSVSTHISKFSSDGELIWQKNYCHNVDEALIGGLIGPRAYHLYQINNDEKVVRGEYKINGVEKCYYLKINSDGDSILLRDSESSIYCSQGLVSYNNSIQSWLKDGTENQFWVYEFDDNFNVTNQILLEGSEDHRKVLISQNNFFLMNNVFGEISFKRYGLQGDLEIESGEYQKIGRFILHNQDGLLAAYDKDLIQFHEDLSENWSLPFNEIFPTWLENEITSTTIKVTADNGYILGGNAFLGDQSFISLAKISEFGEKEWSIVYDPLYLNNTNQLYDVVEAEGGGYILLVRNSVSGKSWVIKLGANGLLTNDSEINYVNPSIGQVLVFPNPLVGNTLNLNFNHRVRGVLRIINLSGNIVYEDKNYNSFQTQIFPNLTPGVYFLSFTDENTNQLTISKLIKLIK